MKESPQTYLYILIGEIQYLTPKIEPSAILTSPHKRVFPLPVQAMSRMANGRPETQPLINATNPCHYEDTPAYEVLKKAGVLETKYRRASIDDIFTGIDVQSNTTKSANFWRRLQSCWCIPGLGCCIYGLTHIETFVPAGHVGFLMNEKNECVN